MQKTKDVYFDEYYYKVGKRYKPVLSFEGFPSSGVWVVKRDVKAGHSALVLKLSNKTYIAKDVVKRALIKDNLTETILKRLNKRGRLSDYDLAQKIADDIISNDNS